MTSQTENHSRDASLILYWRRIRRLLPCAAVKRVGITHLENYRPSRTAGQHGPGAEPSRPKWFLASLTPSVLENYRKSRRLRPPAKRGGSMAFAKGNGRALKKVRFGKSMLLTILFLRHVGPYPSNRLFFGKPFGGRRPASARLPIQSLSSGLATVNVRPAESRQVSPSAMAKTLASEMPPSL